MYHSKVQKLQLYKGNNLCLFSGLSYLFIAVPHTFAKYGLSPFMAFLFYLAYVLIGLHHLVSAHLTAQITIDSLLKKTT
jgi:hypothetical protein